MAKFDLKFLCDHDYENEDFIKAEHIKKDDEFLSDTILITSNMTGRNSYIFLDKSTAIKFAKTLRTEINKIVE